MNRFNTQNYTSNQKNTLITLLNSEITHSLSLCQLNWITSLLTFFFCFVFNYHHPPHPFIIYKVLFNYMLVASVLYPIIQKQVYKSTCSLSYKLCYNYKIIFYVVSCCRGFGYVENNIAHTYHLIKLTFFIIFVFVTM